MTLKALDLIYPRFCVGCDTVVRDRENHICWDCFSSVDILSSPICSICGDPADGIIEHEYTCSWCVNRRPHFDRARSAVRYRGVVKDSLQAFKYNNQIHMVSDLAELLVSCVKTHYSDDEFDAVTVVPLDSKKQRQRSYNQSTLIGQKLASAIGVKCAPECVCRTKAVRPQVELNARQRIMNVKGIFEVREQAWVKGRSFLLVDDVMTTGATVNELSKVLKGAGADRVCVATVARG
jgi:competence protein ComFC